ncbi:MAG: flagellar export chaperone FliS [SAR324 cluster bacterium]|nr:flagellar export chaperone FliS [SAR324 cluster bacterium]
MAQGYRQYSKVYQKAAVSTVDQRKLIVLLYDGAIKFLTIAVNKIESGDSYEAHTNLVRGKSIVAELLASLNLEQGGEIAANLQRLYAYIFSELIDANIERNTSRGESVIEMLKDLRDAWKSLEPSKSAGQEQPDASGQNRGVRKINVRG